jgi:hypothetical protein
MHLKVGPQQTNRWRKGMNYKPIDLVFLTIIIVLNGRASYEKVTRAQNSESCDKQQQRAGKTHPPAVAARTTVRHRSGTSTGITVQLPKRSTVLVLVAWLSWY